MAAHDRIALQQNHGIIDGQLKYTRPFTVLDFLKCLLRPKYHNKILKLRPKIRKANDVDLETAFANAYINFTQYVSVAHKSACNYNIAWQALVRLVAIQCCTTQKDVDIVIPIAFSDPNNATILGRKSVSAIMIQVKNREKKETVDIDVEDINFFNDITPNDTYIKGLDNKHPFISIVMQLGHEQVTDKVTSEESTRDSNRSSTSAQKDNTHCQYKFNIHGVSGVYEGIEETDAINLQNLLSVNTSDDEYARQPVRTPKRGAKKDSEYENIKEIACCTTNSYKINLAKGVNLLPVV